VTSTIKKKNFISHRNITQRVNIIRGECKLYIIITTEKVILGGVKLMHYTGSYFGLFQPCSSVYRSTSRFGLKKTMRQEVAISNRKVQKY